MLPAAKRTVMFGFSRVINLEKKQLLRDANIMPAGEVIAEGLGPAYNSYILFLEKLYYRGVKLNWHYYSDGKAWLAKGLYKWVTSRGTQKETTALWLSIWEDFFRVTIYSGEIPCGSVKAVAWQRCD